MFIDGYIEQLRPHLERAGTSAASYAERICSRLDYIYAAVQENKVWIDNGFENFSKDSLLTATIGRLGTDELWVLTSVSMSAITGVGRIRLDGKIMLHMQTYLATLGLQQVYFQGPGEITIDMNASTQDVTAQFRKFKRRASNKGNRLGFADPVFEADRMGVTDPHRHAGAM